MTAEKKTIVEYRLERAQVTLDEARVLAENESWAGCLNRTYYACFYAVNALLLAHGLSSAKHSGVRSLFNKDFVNTGTVSRESGALYNHLFTNRMDSDYEDLIAVDPEDVTSAFEAAAGFLHEIERLTRQQLEAKEIGDR